MKSKSPFNIQIIFILFMSIMTAHAQEILTLEDAVKIALENNFDIKLAKSNLKIDDANVAIQKLEAKREWRSRQAKNSMRRNGRNTTLSKID